MSEILPTLKVAVSMTISFVGMFAGAAVASTADGMPMAKSNAIASLGFLLILVSVVFGARVLGGWGTDTPEEDSQC